MLNKFSPRARRNQASLSGLGDIEEGSESRLQHLLSKQKLYEDGPRTSAMAKSPTSELKAIEEVTSPKKDTKFNPYKPEITDAQDRNE
jgi:hypothetical protein